jgi:basic membrane protein A
MRKLFVLMGLLVIAALVVPACAPSSATPDCKSDTVFCAALVTDVGKINDKSFNQSCWEGLQQAKTDGVADQIQYIETTDAKSYAPNIDTFANAGYDAIVTCGFNLTEDTYAAAKKYPNIHFIGVDQFLSKDDTHPDWPLPNLIGVVFPEDQSGFLVGALAAAMSKSHKIGAVCGTDLVPPVWRYGEGYKAGAAYADKQLGTTTDVNVIYHSDVGFDKTFVDPEWGATTANAMMDQGVDVVFGCGGTTGNGAVTAAAQRGEYGIGVDSDQYYTLPEAAAHMLSSAMKPIAAPVATELKAVKAGTAQGGLFTGASGYAPYHDLASQVPADVDTMMKAILAGLTDGSITTGVSPAKPAQ